jgi:hypothetical protein
MFQRREKCTFVDLFYESRARTWLPPWGRLIVDSHWVLQKWPAFHGWRSFIAATTRTRHMHAVPNRRILLFKIHRVCVLHLRILLSRKSSVEIALPKLCMHILFPHVPPSSSLSCGQPMYGEQQKLRTSSVCCSCRWGQTVSLNSCHQRAYCSSPRWYMESHGGMILTGENRRSRSKTCPIATLSTKNPTWTDLGEKLRICGERLAAILLSHGTASSFDLQHCLQLCLLLLVWQVYSLLIYYSW